MQKALVAALARKEPNKETVKKYLFSETDQSQILGGLRAEGIASAQGTTTPASEPTRINMITAIRRTLEHELKVNNRVVIFGEDVGPKGGVHGVTLGLQEEFSDKRVFDTGLSEEGIIGRAVGMAICGLMPITEIQFRKYADPATEQLNNCGTIRWRTNNQIAAPMVVRIPGGFAKCGDPWHSVSGEVVWAHNPGWKVAFPSNAEDAVGLLRYAMRGDDPVIFFEHRNLYDAVSARKPYTGDDFTLPFGKAKTVVEGDTISIITWGAMVERCVEAIQKSGIAGEVIDLRTIMPWDKEAVLASVQKTRRCLIVHEDGKTAGFGAEIAAVICEEAFFSLDAPVKRIAVEDIPVPYNIGLMDVVIPSVENISKTITELVEA